MLANERQNAIAALAKQNGAVTTAGLTERFGVSVETIRRDFLLLERQGVLSRVHGGAVSKGDMRPFLQLKERNTEHAEEKRRLSAGAVAYVNEGDIIGIDSGSTAIFFAEALKERLTELTVITHSMDVFEVLHNHRSFRTILCGGDYMESERAFYGAVALETLGNFRLGKVFLFASAISLEFGICDYNIELMQMQKKLLSVAENAYFLADSSKFERRALMKLADMKSEYTYVTDDGLPQELRTLYAENQKNILIGE